MHNRNEVQPPISLPDLSAWHRVPVGAVIPKGVPCAYTFMGVITVDPDGYRYDTTVSPDDGYTHYTELPISPPLPTEEGATILVSSVERPPHILLELQDGRWVNRYGDKFAVDQIRAWAPVTIGEVVVVS